ncbi:glycoside hydrolase family 3 protein [Marinifaba aquimaris]|uniref:glycoside hydrolase family 3 protein n=1 Tax=Marinifaba aquimaris TaxID=2741323 RepID=UPI001FECE347|nr:glycoside hydrolase family 3 protein [Marinifaba aquimaris]
MQKPSDSANGQSTPNELAQWPKINSAIETDTEIERQVAAMVAKMTLAQKVGQMLQAEVKSITPEQVKQFHIGSVLNGGGSIAGSKDGFATVDEWLAMADGYYQASMDDTDGGIAIPIIWGTDSMHGASNIIGATIFPHNIGLGAANNPELIKKIGEVTAKESLVSGVDWLFAPTVAVVRDDRWGRTYEAFSEHPDIVARYAPAMVEGLQGKAGSKALFTADKVLANVKHFIGDGGTTNGDDQGDTQISEKELREVHGAGYFTALDAGAQVVMASFNSWNGEKVHGHQYLLTQVLKQQMGFDGFIVSDWNGHGQVKGCSNDRCAQAINAGIDMVMVPTDWQALFYNLIDDVEKGNIAMSRIDDAVTRILRVKMRMGIFQAGLPSKRPFAGKTEHLYSAEHKAVARQAVRESLVLLKNNEQTLPILPSQKVLLVGQAADDIGQASGGWTVTWQGVTQANQHFPSGTSIKQAIEQQVKSAGGQFEYSLDGQFNQKPDIAIVVFGEKPYAEMHGDLTTLEYQAGFHSDLKLIKQLKSQGIKVVSVFLSGRPLWVNAEINVSDAFVAAWLPGSEGTGVADVLLATPSGKVQYDFVGKLSFSWPNEPTQATINWQDKPYQPAFAYGYGLNYQDGGFVGQLSDVTAEDTHSEKIDLFVGRPLAPWQIEIKNTQGEAQSIRSLLPQKINDIYSISTDHLIQGDSRHIGWIEGGAKVGLFSKSALDLSAYQQKGVLQVFINLPVKLTANLTLSMEQASGQVASIDLTDALSSMSAKTWYQLNIGMKCFAKQGADFSHISAPFVLSSNAKAEVKLSNIRLFQMKPDLNPAKSINVCL